MRLSNLRLAQKLGLGFSSILLPLLIISATAYFRIGEISEEIQTITVSTYPKTVSINSVVENLGIQAQSLRNLLIEDNSDKIAAEEKIVAQTGAEIKQALAEFESKIATRKGHEMFEKVAEYRTKFVQSREKFTQLLNSGQHDQAKQFLQEMNHSLRSFVMEIRQGTENIDTA